MIPHNVALSVDETGQMSELLQAKFIQTMAGRCATQYPEVCGGCGTGEFGSAADRVELSWADRIVKPCRACRPADFAAYHAMIARHEESQGLDKGVTDAPVATMAGCLGGVSPSGLRPQFDPSKCDHGSEHAGRVEFDWCQNCAPARWNALEPAPATLRTGAAPDGIERRDPWDVPADEQIATVALPREVPAYWGRDRGDYDANDDKSDIESHDRLTRYPWGGR